MLPELSIEAFRTYVDRRNSRNTSIKYAQAAGKFLAFCSRQGLEIQNLPPGILSLFADAMYHDGMKDSSVKTMVSGVSKYIEWCRMKGQSLPVMASPDLPKIHKPPPNALTNEALIKFIQLASRLHEPIRTSLIVLPFCGLRSFELANLELRHLQIVTVPANSIREAQSHVCFAVKGKGGKHRVVPLLLDGKPLLLSYLRKWRKFQTGPYLFPMANGTPIAVRTIRFYVQKIREHIGINKFTPHTLRRTYITTLHRHGIDIPTLTRIAGHASVQTTMDHYLAIEKEDIAGSVSGVRLVAKGAMAERVEKAGASAANFLSASSASRGVLDIPDIDPLDENGFDDEDEG